MVRPCAPTRSFAIAATALAAIALAFLYWDFETLDTIYQPSPRSSLDAAPASIRVLQQYKKWHSHGSLVQWQKEMGNSSISSSDVRQFAVVYYSCPHRAGNVLHSFFNAVIWAIVHNRTLLYSYDEEAAHNHIEECNQVASMNPWVPSYDYWSDALQLPTPVPIRMNTRRTKQQLQGHFYTRQEQRASLQNPVVIYPLIPDVQPSNPFISRVSWWEDPRRLTRPCLRNLFYFQRTLHLSSSWSKRTLQHLYAEGLYFLYGLLFREFFTIHAAIPAVTEQSIDDDDDDDDMTKGGGEGAVISIALHSRHSNSADDGSDVSGERRCLERWVHTPKSQCIVYLMSDRNITLYQLAAWLEERNCTALWAPHAAEPTWGSNAEHGPFAGADFWRDLAFCARATTAVVGDFTRSSTALLLDLVSYDRDHKDPLQLCHLPDRPEGPKRRSRRMRRRP